MWNPFRRKRKDTSPKPEEPRGPNETDGPDIFIGGLKELAEYLHLDQVRAQQILDRARQKVIAAQRAISDNERSDEVRVIAESGNDKAGYFTTHPPRCLAGFKTQRVELPGMIFDGHASAPPLEADVPGVPIEGSAHFNLVVQLSCVCGCGVHYVLGHYWRSRSYSDRLVFVSPLARRCSECGKFTEFFDSDIHGHDAEIGAVPTNYRGDGERSEFECARCGPTGFQAIARFEYSDDIFDPRFEQFRGREQDVFSWFTLVGKCSGCSRLLEIADFECA